MGGQLDGLISRCPQLYIFLLSELALISCQWSGLALMALAQNRLRHREEPGKSEQMSLSTESLVEVLRKGRVEQLVKHFKTRKIDATELAGVAKLVASWLALCGNRRSYRRVTRLVTKLAS